VSAARAITYGGLTVGILDALDAMIFYGLWRGAMPARVWQGVAFGLLGRPAIEGGLVTAFLGLAIHFFIAFSVAAVYYLASRKLSLLQRQWILCGMLYGIGVHFFMQHVVMPLSLIGTPTFRWPVFWNGVIGHALIVGLPAAYFARERD
jgi:hypothetical protein